MAVRDATDEEVAHHEAGHVVSAMVLGIEVTSVSIKRTRNGSDGRMRRKRRLPDGINVKLMEYCRQVRTGQSTIITDPVLRKYFLDQIVILFAGPYAEKHFYPDSLWAHGGGTDMAAIDGHLERLEADAGERYHVGAVCACAAKDIIKDMADRIRLVAAALLVHQKLTAKQIKKLMTLELPTNEGATHAND